MDATSSPGLYPLHRCKTLHLARHAQGIHNVAGEKDHDAYSSQEYFDAHITPLGWHQVDNLRKHVQETGLSKKIDLVIVSPLLRTMQTAVGVFGGEEGYKDGIDDVVPPLMVADGGESHRPEISSLNCPPFVAVELCRERWGIHPCDRRKSISQYRPLFPAIDFSLIESDEDILWEANNRENNEELAVRGMKFLNWLWTRKEKEIAIVTHSGFLHNTLSAFGSDCHPSVKTEICKHFSNCELRSVVIVDRRTKKENSNGHLLIQKQLPCLSNESTGTEMSCKNKIFIFFYFFLVWLPLIHAGMIRSDQNLNRILTMISGQACNRLKLRGGGRKLQQ